MLDGAVSGATVVVSGLGLAVLTWMFTAPEEDEETGDKVEVVQEQLEDESAGTSGAGVDGVEEREERAGE